MPYLAAETNPTAEPLCRRLVIPADLNIIIAVSGALEELTYARNWQQTGDVTPEEMAQMMLTMFRDFLSSNHACP